MADLKRDLDEYLLLQENQKKNFKLEMPKMPSLPTPDLMGKLFGRNQEPEANSWLKDTQDTCCPKLVGWAEGEGGRKEEGFCFLTVCACALFSPESSG